MVTVSAIDLDDRFASDAYEAWLSDLRVKRSVEQIRKLNSPSREGIEIRALAHQADVESPWRAFAAQRPGDFPHLRACAVQGSRTVCLQERNEADIELVASRLREEVGRGVTGAWLRLDAAIMAEGRSATVRHNDGIALKTLSELVSLHGSSSPQSQWRVECGALTALEFAEAKDFVTFQASCPGVELGIDPLAALVRRGQIAGPIEGHLGALREVLARGDARRNGKFHLLIGTDHFHEAGAHAVDELALSLAAAAEYMRALSQSGGDLELAVADACLLFSVGGDVFMEIAKLRAARVVHACLLEACGVRGKRLRLHARSSRRGLSLDDPETNLLRTTLGTYAALVGGADSQAIVPHLGDDLPEGSEARAGRRLAANLHHILGEEARLAAVADPGGGSYHLESLTSALVRRAWQEFQNIESAGGLLRGLRHGYVQKRLARQRAEQVHELSLGERCLVGATLHAGAAPRGPRGSFRGVDGLDPPPSSRCNPVDAGTGGNDSREPTIDRLVTLRWAHDFEAVRGSIECMVSEGRARPRALLVSDELSARRRPVIDWAADRCRVIGLEICGESTAQDYADAPGHELVVLCIDAEDSEGGLVKQPGARASEVSSELKRAAGVQLIWASRVACPQAETTMEDFADFNLVAGCPQLSVMARIAAWCTGKSVKLSTPDRAEK